MKPAGVLGYHLTLATRTDTGRGAARPEAEGLGEHRPGSRRFIDPRIARIILADLEGDAADASVPR